MLCSLFGEVADFEGQILDMDPDFGQYWHFWGTVINVGTDRNPYKRFTTNQIIPIRSSSDRLSVKVVIFEDILVPPKASKLRGFVK